MKKNQFMLLLCIFFLSSCSNNVWYYNGWYHKLDGYDSAEKKAKEMAMSIGNSFLYGTIEQNYSIWSYNIVNKVIVVYKYHKNDLISYQIYNYDCSFEWLKHYKPTEVSMYIFWNFPILDGIPIVYNSFQDKRLITADLNVSYNCYLQNDSIKNDFLKSLKDDIIRYNLVK